MLPSRFQPVVGMTWFYPLGYLDSQMEGNLPGIRGMSRPRGKKWFQNIEETTLKMTSDEVGVMTREEILSDGLW
jgi:hypothetical protein